MNAPASAPITWRGHGHALCLHACSIHSGHCSEPIQECLNQGCPAKLSVCAPAKQVCTSALLPHLNTCPRTYQPSRCSRWQQFSIRMHITCVMLYHTTQHTIFCHHEVSSGERSRHSNVVDGAHPILSLAFRAGGSPMCVNVLRQQSSASALWIVAKGRCIG